MNRSLEYISYSRIRLFSKNILDYKKRYIDKIAIKPTPAMEFGSLLHYLLLENSIFFDKYFVDDNSSKQGIIDNIYELRNTIIATGEDERLKALKIDELKKIKKDLLEKEEKIIISNSNYEKALKLVDSIRKTLFYKISYKDIINREESMTEHSFEGELKGIKTLAYIDLLTRSKNGKHFAFDFKTTSSSESKKIKSTFKDYGYAYQAHFYRDILKQNDIDIEDFYFVFIDKNSDNVITSKYSFQNEVEYQKWISINIENLKYSYETDNFEIQNQDTKSNILDLY